MSIPQGPIQPGMPGFDSVPTGGENPKVNKDQPANGQTQAPKTGAAPAETVVPAVPGQTQAPADKTIYQGEPAVSEQSPTTETTKPLPRTEQPIKDQISQSGNIPQPNAERYTASTQFPVLPKPQEQKPVDKKQEKESSKGTDDSQKSDGNSQLDGNVIKDQQEGGGKGGSGTGDNSDSDKGGSNSGNSNNGDKASTDKKFTDGTKVTEETKNTPDAKAKDGTEKTADGAEKTVEGEQTGDGKEVVDGKTKGAKDKDGKLIDGETAGPAAPESSGVKAGDQAPAGTKSTKKSTAKEGSEGTGASQQSDGGDKVDGAPPKTVKDQQEEGGQGGGTGGNAGSDSGNSGSGGFSNGGDKKGGNDPSGSIGGKKVAGAAAAEIEDAPQAVNLSEETEAAYQAALDPTGKAVRSASGLFSPPTNGPQFFDNGTKLMQEITAMNAAMAKSMPEGPEKMRFADFLKVVQDALNQFQQLLRELQMNDSKGAKERSQAQLEASLEKIEKQREEQAEMAKKSDEAAKKAKIMGPLAIIFAFLLVILLAVLMVLFLAVLLMTFPPMGLLVIALIVGEFLDQCATAVGKKPFAIQGIANAVMAMVNVFVETFAKVFGGTEEGIKVAKAVLKTVTVVLVMAISTVLSPGLILFGGVSALLSFLNASHVIKDASLAAGLDETAAQQAEMYTSIVVGALYAVAAFAVAFILPSGAIGTIAGNFTRTVNTIAQNAARLVLFLLAKVMELTDKATSIIGKVVQAIIRTLFNPETWVQATQTGLQATNAAATYKYQTLLADIALIQGEMDSYTELKDATIQMLKKMIKQLLDGLSAIGDDIAAVGNILKKTHTGVSDITGSLFG